MLYKNNGLSWLILLVWPCMLCLYKRYGQEIYNKLQESYQDTNTTPTQYRSLYILGFVIF
jgi:hypothetical protein